MENKKKINYFKYIFIILFTSYLVLFLASNNGYYEYKNRQKNILTEEQIKKFEQDILDGKNVDLEEYIEPQIQVGSSNKTLSLKLSEIICSYTREAIEQTFKVLSKTIEN